MHIDHDARFASLTTLRLGGAIPALLTAETVEDVVDAIHHHQRHHLLVMGGGSNLVVADEGVDHPVLRLATSGVEVASVDGGIELTVAAGENWDALVDRAAEEGWSGIEALSGIPGLVGATPIQNVGAYGQELSQVCVGAEVVERKQRERRSLTAKECEFSYRSSAFKRDLGRYVVTAVRLRLWPDAMSQPIGYAELAQRLDVPVGERAPLREVREAVLEIRRSKGMVLDDSDHDTWSAGSFFTNPIVDADKALPPEAPRWPQPDGRVKTSAAWLIQDAGFDRGFGEQVGRGAITVSNKHTLALTNRSEGTTTELVELARLIRERVHDQFTIWLEPEPTLVGIEL